MIYLASPYTNQQEVLEEQRFKYTCLAAARLIVEGFHVYSPIAMSHPIHETSKGHRCSRIAALHNKAPKFWYKFDEAMMDRCERLVILGLHGWRESIGVACEYSYFKRKSIPWTMVSRSEERRVGKECRSRWSPYH